MMYFCNYTFEASKHSKYLQPAIDILMQADSKAFRDCNDVEILAVNARQALEKAKPKGNSAYLAYNDTDKGDITICIFAANDGSSGVARAFFKPIRGFVTFSIATGEWKKLKSINLYNKEDGQ